MEGVKYAFDTKNNILMKQLIENGVDVDLNEEISRWICDIIATTYVRGETLKQNDSVERIIATYSNALCCTDDGYVTNMREVGWLYAKKHLTLSWKNRVLCKQLPLSPTQRLIKENAKLYKKANFCL